MATEMCIRDRFLEGNYPDIDFHFIENADFKTTNNIYSLWLTKPPPPKRGVGGSNPLWDARKHRCKPFFGFAAFFCSSFSR